MRRILLICETLADGKAFLSEHDTSCEVTLVPMRSPARVRGISVDGIYSTLAARAHPNYEDVLEDAIPAVATSNWLSASVFEDG